MSPAKRSARILVVEDEQDIRESFCGILEAEGYRTQGASSLSEGRHAAVQFAPQLVLLDLGLPDGNGIELLEELRSERPELSVVVITAETKVEVAVKAMRLGATDYLEKPIGLDRLLTTARLCLESGELRAENRQLREQALSRFQLIGNSEPMQTLRQQIERVADNEIPVLVTGENGTGKELVARHLHLCSSRYGAPFLATNCAAVPETLIESEFFGHVRGAFTGADRDRPGLFLEAGEGTLFLDEIGEMPISLQARLLRVLQERQVQPIGSTEQRPISCRIVTATNKRLEDEIEAGAFREDLYYRIRGVELHVPSLRDRPSDIPLLAQHFLDKHAPSRSSTDGREAEASLGKSGRNWLLDQAWPGNVRQLESLIRAAVLLADEPELEARDFESLARPLDSSGTREDPVSAFLSMEDLKEFREAIEKEFLRRKLEEENWNVSATARRIGIRRTNLHERLKHHGLK